MPRGNDGDAAGKELSARLGGADLNAEDLIKRNAERWPAGLRAANAKRVDPDATAALDVAAIEKHVGKDSEVLGYAVRGGSVVVVSEDENGEVSKEAIALSDLGRSGAKAEKASGDGDEAQLAAHGRVAPEAAQSTPRK